MKKLYIAPISELIIVNGNTLLSGSDNTYDSDGNGPGGVVDPTDPTDETDKPGGSLAKDDNMWNGWE